MEKGTFVISLDFELHWGVADIWDLDDRLEYFDTTRKSIPLVLDLFTKHKIHATWATVGYLFATDRAQLLSFFPKKLPTYSKYSLSNYTLFNKNLVGENEEEDPYHFAPSLIELILKTPNQELGSHTFSHYYCNEEGQTAEDFNLDLEAAQKIAKENFNIHLESLVFPRNQVNDEYLEIAKQNGIKVVRTNPDVWFWKMQSKGIGFARAIDTLISISKTVTFDNYFLKKNTSILSLPASRFLRPFAVRESSIQKLKVNRIKNEMLYAARNGRNYHLWWHPHNFGYSLDSNLEMLEDILSYYEELNEKYEFSSKTMIEMYRSV